MFLWWGVTGVLLYIAAKQHMEQIPLTWYREKQVQEEIRLLGEYHHFLQKGYSKSFRVKKIGPNIVIHMKVARRWYTFLYQTESKVVRYDRNYQHHPLLLRMGIQKTNEMMRQIGESYRKQEQQEKEHTKQNQHFSKWQLCFTTYESSFRLTHYSETELFVKKIYIWEDIKMVHFQYEDGTQRLLLLEGDNLEGECTYDIADKRCYMTQRTVGRNTFSMIEGEFVSFLESFCKKEREGIHDKKIEQQIVRQMENIHRYQKEESFQKEWEELWGYYQGIPETQRVKYIPSLQDALSHLETKRSVTKQTLTVKEQNHEN